MLFPSNKFIWRKDSKTFSQEASNLGMGLVPLMIELKSIATGAILTFHLYEGCRDQEGDFTHWVFHPDKKHTNEAAETQLIIYND